MAVIGRFFSSFNMSAMNADNVDVVAAVIPPMTRVANSSQMEPVTVIIKSMVVTRNEISST